MTDRPTNARIEPVGEPDAELQEILAGALTHDGTPLNIFGVLGRHPK
jgi:4-carboxymuconolactone decarboxylase